MSESNKAYTEVLEIIKYLPKEEYDKIPKEKIEFFEKNKDPNYSFTINPEEDLATQNISREANAIIVVLYRDYFATEKQKEDLEQILELNQRKEDINKSIKYDPDKIFESKEEIKEEPKEEPKELEEYKETFFERFKRFILRLIGKE